MEQFANLTPEGVEMLRQTEQKLQELTKEPVILLAYRTKETKEE